MHRFSQTPQINKLHKSCVALKIIMIITTIIIIINTSTYARKQGYNWTKNTGMNMYQNQ